MDTDQQEILLENFNFFYNFGRTANERQRPGKLGLDPEPTGKVRDSNPLKKSGSERIQDQPKTLRFAFR